MQFTFSRLKHAPSRLPRTLLHVIATLILTSLALCLSIEAGKCEEKPKNDNTPNIIFILTDDQRCDAMGCAGNKLIRTPHLDALAGRGVRFANAFVTLSICSPSRAACLTGQYGSTNGVTTLGQPLRNAAHTFARRFQRAGYRTAHMGKWHLKQKPTELGFDESDYFTANGAYRGRKVVINGRPARIDQFIDDWVAERSVRFIHKVVAERKPFVLWMCTQVPHMDDRFDWPSHQKYLSMYRQSEMPVPATWRGDLAGKPEYLKTARSRTQALRYGYDHKSKLQRHIQRYYAAVSQVDASIGKVLDSLEKLGVAQNTYVIFMGDNGWFLGEHGFTSKVLAYEESIRVPMIIAGPGIKKGVDQHLVLNVDLPATLFDLAGLKPSWKMHGRSLAPLLRNESIAWRDDFVYEAPTPTLGSHPIMAARTSRWKYIETYSDRELKQVEFHELYDLSADPDETRNLAVEPQHAEIVGRLAAQLRAFKAIH